MSKTSVIQRALKRKKIVNRYLKKRIALKSIISKVNITEDERWSAQLKLQKLPVNSSPVRLRNRCVITGRSRGVYRKFGLCRNKLREHAMLGNIPGLTKASW